MPKQKDAIFALKLSNENNIKILVNDEVEVEISAYDFTKCRITYRYK